MIPSNFVKLIRQTLDMRFGRAGSTLSLSASEFGGIEMFVRATPEVYPFASASQNLAGIDKGHRKARNHQLKHH